MVVAKMRAATRCFADRVHHLGVGVAQQQRAVAHQEIDVLIAVDVPLAPADSAIDVERHGASEPQIVAGAARQHTLRPLEQLTRFRSTLGILVTQVDCHRVSLLTRSSRHQRFEADKCRFILSDSFPLVILGFFQLAETTTVKTPIRGS